MSLTKKAILKRTPVLLYACLLQNEHCIEADRMPPLWVQFRLETRARRPTCPIARIAPAAVLVSIQLKLLCLITTLVFAALGATAIMVTSPIGISTKAAAVGFVDQATAKAAGAVPRSVASIYFCIYRCKASVWGYSQSGFGAPITASILHASGIQCCGGAKPAERILRDNVPV